tara:strand:- start:28600 stop:28806 length:207 start_codon:yes stop_codon:yes gene_type:complete
MQETTCLEIIKEAKANPNGWVYKIDQKYDLSGDIPPEAIVGAWAVDSKGEITGDFIQNKKYIPLSIKN